jgi:hypothetical protein
MITKFLKFTGSLLLVLTCAGCLKTPIQRPKNLKPLTQETSHDSQTKEQVTVYAKKLDFEDQELMFGSCAKQLKKYHIVPVQLTIENNGTTAWVLADKNIILNKLTVDEVNARLFASRRLNPLWIFLGGLAFSYFVLPIIFYLPTAYLYEVWTSACLFIITSTAVVGTCSCIAVADGIVNHMSKKQMRTYLTTYCNMGGVTINPDINASMLFFVKESQLPEKLNLLLTGKNIEKHTLPFTLTL